MTDHPSGQPEFDGPGILQRLADAAPVGRLGLCAVCLYREADPPQDAVTTVVGNAVCLDHFKAGFTLEVDARAVREYQKHQQVARLRGMIGSP